jgi:hypothetical protein
MEKNKAVKFAEKDTLPAKIDPKDEMVLISVRMEGDLLDSLKMAAEQTNMGYQTIMKELLRERLGLDPKVHLPKAFSSSMDQDDWKRNVLDRLEKIEKTQRRPMRRKSKRATG